MEKDLKVIEYLVCFYDGDNHYCFDEDRYSYECFKEAYEYNMIYNKDFKKGDDYTKLWAYVKDVGLILLNDYK